MNNYSNYSSKLKSCIKGDTLLSMEYDKANDEFELISRDNENYVALISFDPWTGKELRNTYDFQLIESYRDALNYGHEFIENKIKKFLDEFGPIDSQTNRNWWNKQVGTSRDQHSINSVCNEVQEYLKGGKDEGVMPIIHIPNIRAYAILNKKEYGGFEPMDYCPFCGAKFPERLDNKLSEILQKECGLKSWKDYKKAPREFHTDEWWKKRAA